MWDLGLRIAPARLAVPARHRPPKEDSGVAGGLAWRAGIWDLRCQNGYRQGRLIAFESRSVVIVVFAVNVYINRFLGVDDEPVAWMDGRSGVQSIPNDKRGQGYTKSLGNGGKVVTFFDKINSLLLVRGPLFYETPISSLKIL
jgi:hypothetical protein